MSEADLKINSKVRKILTEYNVDLSQLGISTASGSVTIRGELRKLMGAQMKDSELARFIWVLESVILRTKGIKRVTFSLKGWKKEKGKWSKEER